MEPYQLSQEPSLLPQSVLSPYTGGHTVIWGGYIFELCPDHPKANPFGFVPQHRLVVERHIGRYLERKECVHHIDFSKTNNSLGNLQVLSQSDHMRLHRLEKHNMRKLAPLTEENVRKALLGGLKGAAKELGVHTTTLRNRFPELVAPHKRKSPTKIDDPLVIETIRRLAMNVQFGFRDIARETGISVQTVERIVRKQNIPWKRKTKAGEKKSKYVRTKPLPDTPDLVQRLTRVAADPMLTVKEAAKVLGISHESIRNYCQKHGIDWVAKSQKGIPRHTYRDRKSSRSSSEPCGSQNGSAYLKPRQMALL